MCECRSPAIFSLLLFSFFFSASGKSDKIKSFDDMEPLSLIFDFAEDDIHEKWIVVNDNVMGGRSKGGFDFKNEKLIFPEVRIPMEVAFLPFEPSPLTFISKTKQVCTFVTRVMGELINLVFVWKGSLFPTVLILLLEMVGRKQRYRLIIWM